MSHVVIVGAGQAGLVAAETLRAGGFEGAISLLGDEPDGPYHRPPLSKAWLAGEIDAAQLTMRAPGILAKKGISLRTATAVRAIDRAARVVRLADGSALEYTGLVLATGATPRALPLPGARSPNVLALRSRDDATAIAARLALCAEQARPLVVIGGGFIGMEVAATARKKGVDVTVLEAAPRLMARALPPVLSDWYATLHRRHGVEVVLGAGVAGIDVEDGLAVAVRTADGARRRCGLVLVGVGVVQNDALAREAGLACDRGIIVDDCCRTEDPAITAAGDCTARRLADGTLLRLESVNNANEQGKSAATALLGTPRPFTGAPWFWSDQYDCKLQMAGLSAGADQTVVRGSTDTPPFSVFHFRAGRLVAADTINAPREHLLVRKLLDAGLSPTPQQAADTAFDLNSLLAAPPPR